MGKIQSEVIEVLDEQVKEYQVKGEDRKDIMRIHMITYNGKPKLGKQSFWTDAKGEVKPGKVKQFDPSDWEIIANNAEKITAFFAKYAEEVPAS